MLDKIYYKSDKEVVLIFTHRIQATLWSSNGKVLELLDEFLAPLSSSCETMSEYVYRLKVEKEDTVIINLDKVA